MAAAGPPIDFPTPPSIPIATGNNVNVVVDDDTPAQYGVVPCVYPIVRELNITAVVPRTMAAVSANERKAQEHMASGLKESKRWFGGTTKFENAAEHYSKAGLSFKLAKNFDAAAGAYTQAAEMHQKAGSDHDMATAMKEAGLMYLKAGKGEKAKTTLAGAAEIFSQMNRLSTAGKMLKQVAEMYEASHDNDEAKEFYQRAAEMFALDTNSTSAANQCRAKVGFYLAEEESFGKAAEVFEEVGTSYLDNNLLKFNARTHFTDALLCHLANDDMVMVTRKLKQYKESDYQFADSRECRLIEGCQAAFADRNVDGFVEAVSEFDRISKLNPWRVSMLLKIKSHITAEEEEDLS